MDHAASTHPPAIVLDTYRDFLERSYSNVHRGSHYLSQLATDRFEEVRDVVRRFIFARGDGSTITFLGNTTQALDLAAHVMEKCEGVNREAAIAVRNGCFCAHLYVHRLLGLTDASSLRRRLEAGEGTGLPGAVRPSFGVFNTEEDVERLLQLVRCIRDGVMFVGAGGIARPA